jgi:hypothetical protein
MVCHQGGPQGARDHWWTPGGAARPEDALGGGSYRHGGGWWDGARTASGYRVLQPGHWAFEGAGLERGDLLGNATWPPLPGYECDGVPLEHDAQDADAQDADGIRIARWASACGTPNGYELLAVAPLGPGWQELPAREDHAAGGGVHAASLGLFTRGDGGQRRGCVFSAGSTDWAQVLGGARDRRIERITRNVLDHLLYA